MDRWNEMTGIRGWTTTKDYSEVEVAHKKRHPSHWSYLSVAETKPLTEEEAEAYGSVNDKLHETLRLFLHAYFEGMAVPPAFAEANGDWDYFSPFTYHNLDWYGPSYEVPIRIYKDVIDAKLLCKIQAHLTGEFEDWCIIVGGSDDASFDLDHEIYIFSDQVIIDSASAESLAVPLRFLE